MRVLHLLSPMPRRQTEDGSGEDARLILPQLLSDPSADLTQELLGLDGLSARQWGGWLGREVPPVSMRLPGSTHLLARALEGRSFDVLHAWGAEAGVRAAHLDRMQNGTTPWPLLISPGSLPVGPNHITPLLDLNVLTRSGLIVGSDFLCRMWRQAGLSADRVHTLAPGIPEFPSVPEKKTINPKTPAPPTVLAVPAPGVCTHPTDVVWAGALLRQLVPDLRVVVYGDGPSTESVRRFATGLYVPDLTEFAGGEVPLPRLIQAADVVLFAAAQEATTTPLVWAMAGGAAIVATRTPVTESLIEPEQNGLLAQPGSPRALAGQALRLLEDPVLARRLGQAARISARQFPDMSAMRENYRRLWQHMMA